MRARMHTKNGPCSVPPQLLCPALHRPALHCTAPAHSARPYFCGLPCPVLPCEPVSPACCSLPLHCSARPGRAAGVHGAGGGGGGGGGQRGRGGQGRGRGGRGGWPSAGGAGGRHIKAPAAAACITQSHRWWRRWAMGQHSSRACMRGCVRACVRACVLSGSHPTTTMGCSPSTPARTSSQCTQPTHALGYCPHMVAVDAVVCPLFPPNLS